MIRASTWIMLSSAMVLVPSQDKPAPGLPVDVYILAGQSNMTGQGTLSQLPPGVGPDPRAWLFHSNLLKSACPPMTWGPLRPASETREKFGPEVAFGNRMQQLTKDRPVALIKHGLTSTEMKWSWYPGKDPEDRVRMGRQFKLLAATVEAGLKGLREKGFEPTLRGMAWHQGETDATEEVCAKEYLTNLCLFIPRIREELRASDLVFVYGMVLPPPNNHPYREVVRTAQGAVDQDSGSAWAAKNAFVVFTDDLPFFDVDPALNRPRDPVHFGTFGTMELGRRMAESMARRGKLPR